MTIKIYLTLVKYQNKTTHKKKKKKKKIQQTWHALLYNRTAKWGPKARKIIHLHELLSLIQTLLTTRVSVNNNRKKGHFFSARPF